MIVKEEFLSKLRRYFSLNLYEVKIWAALLSRGTSTAGELSDIANVPRSRSYDVLESLEKKGFVVMKPGKPIKYLAVEPKEVLDNVKKQIEQKTHKLILDIKSKSFNDLINNLQEMHESNTNTVGDTTAILKGNKNIRKHLEYLFKNAKKEIIMSEDQELKQHLGAAGKIKNINKNIEIKSHDSKMRLYTIDNDNSLIFPLSGLDVHPDYDFCIWVKHKETTEFLKGILSQAI